MLEMNRRQFLRALGAGAALSLPQCSRPGEPPNIVIIMADDMGFSDIGCYGGEISTPNLDRLAARGLRFSQFYSASRCCPTRASLLTGLYQHQAGVGHMVGDKGVPSYQGYLNDQCVTIAEALRPAGYTTLMAGKWHVGEEPQHWPTKRGFDRYFGLISGGSNYFKLDSARQMSLDGEPFTPAGEDFYLTDAFSDYAVKFLAENGSGKQPFFLYVPYTAPHWPLHAWPEDIARYKGKYRMGWDELRRQRHPRMIEMGLVDQSWPLSPRDPEVPAWEDVDDHELQDLKMAVYAAQIETMDRGIGRILDKIREVGKEENTLVMFLADNGGCHEEVNIPKGTGRNTYGDPEAPPGPWDSFDSYGRAWANASNTPFRMFKSWVHEGGISSPLICCWPAGITQPAGSITDEPGHIIDLMATCLDVGKGEYPARFQERAITPLEGKSLRPIFESGAREGHETLFWEHEGNRAVRMGKWKLVSAFNDKNKEMGPWELYDLETDRSELTDLAASEGARVQAMEGAYRNWAARAGVVAWNELPS